MPFGEYKACCLREHATRFTMAAGEERHVPCWLDRERRHISERTRASSTDAVVSRNSDIPPNRFCRGGKGRGRHKTAPRHSTLASSRGGTPADLFRLSLVLVSLSFICAFGAASTLWASDDPGLLGTQPVWGSTSIVEDPLSYSGFEPSEAQKNPPADISDDTPILVHLRMKDLDVAEVDLGSNTFEAAFELLMSWNDPPTENEEADRSFTPNIIFANAETELSNTIYGISQLEDGAISVWSSHRIVFSTTLDAQHYPFDMQKLPIVILIYTENNRSISYDFQNMEADNNSEQGDWKVASLQSAIIPFGFQSEGFGVQTSVLELNIEAHREFLKPFLLVFLPIAGAALISITTFGLPEGDTASRQGMSTTALLLAIAFTFTLYDLISFDSEEGLSRITVFFLVCMAIPLIAFFFSLLHLSIRTAMGESRVSMIENALFWASLAAIVTTYFYTWNCGTFLAPPYCAE